MHLNDTVLYGCVFIVWPVNERILTIWDEIPLTR